MVQEKGADWTTGEGGYFAGGLLLDVDTLQVPVFNRSLVQRLGCTPRQNVAPEQNPLFNA